MKDLRTYNKVIREAVKEQNKKDEWKFSVKAVNKGVARIGWGYLDYMGETDKFELTVESLDDDTDLGVAVKFPSGHNIYVLVGPTRWDDAKTIEDGIRLAIEDMGRRARAIY